MKRKKKMKRKMRKIHTYNDLKETPIIDPDDKTIEHVTRTDNEIIAASFGQPRISV